jgi:hypothetical protein
MAQIIRIKCKDCAYWNESTDKTTGFCRRHSPVILSLGDDIVDPERDSFFPITYKNDWCGESAPVTDVVEWS